METCWGQQLSTDQFSTSSSGLNLWPACSGVCWSSLEAGAELQSQHTLGSFVACDDYQALHPRWHLLTDFCQCASIQEVRTLLSLPSWFPTSLPPMERAISTPGPSVSKSEQSMAQQASTVSALTLQTRKRVTCND